MAKKNKRNTLRDWYSISVDTVRLWLSGALCLFLLGLGYLGYQDWQRGHTERSAHSWFARAEALMGQARQQADLRVYSEELNFASSRLERARAALELAEFGSAEKLARDSHQVLQGILDALRLDRSIAWFRSVQGDVRFRRGEEGEFQRAFARIELQDGDYVMSAANASAEIHFREEDAVFTLRPRSLVKLTRQLAGNQSTLGEMEYGWVALSTARVSTAVRSRSTELVVGENSNASLAMDQGSTTAEVRVDAGDAVAVASGTGERRKLGDRQRVEVRNDRITPTVSLLPAVSLVGPEDGTGVNIDTDQEVLFQWQATPGAVRYALQVSTNRLFAPAHIDERDIRRTQARIGLREPGTFAWRVAAIDARGHQGAWSEPWWVRVDSYRTLAMEIDREQPLIEVEVFMNGNLALLQGRTEPGAELEVNGRPIPVAADGSFVSTQWFFGSGRIPLIFRAVDAAGNDTVSRRWIYLDEA